MLILSRLPQDVRLEWARESEGRESDLDWLTFLASEINQRERSQSFRDASTLDPVTTTCEEKMRSARKASASALHVHSNVSVTDDVQLPYDVCGVKGHKAERCWNLTKLSTVSERRSKVQMCGLCFWCLRRGHVAKGCLNKCDNVEIDITYCCVVHDRLLHRIRVVLVVLAHDQTVIYLFHILLNRNTLTVICHLLVNIMYMLTVRTVRESFFREVMLLRQDVHVNLALVRCSLTRALIGIRIE